MADPARDYGRALLVLVLGACAIAFSAVFVRLTGTGPAAAGVWRLGLAAPALLAMSLLAVRGRAAALAPRPILLAAGLFFALDLGFWHYGIHYTTVANSTILANLSPVFVTAGAWLLLRERPARLFLVGLALALAGAWTLAAGHSGAGGGLDPPLGDGLSVATAVWYAAYLLATRRAREGRPASVVMLWASLVGVPLLLAAALGLHERLVPVTAGGWLACVGLAAVHVAGQGAIAWALGKVPAAVASVVVLAQPVLTAVLGWIIFHEAMSPLQMLGGVVALAGVALAQAAAARARRTP